MNSHPKRVAIIGGGVIGTACAHFLAYSGWRVTIIDQGSFGQGSSHANCGLVSPSHILPLAAPGAVRGALQALVRSNSPLKIRPRFDPALWAWLVRFALRGNRRDMIQAGRAIEALLNSSRLLYGELFDSGVLDAEWETQGLLIVQATAKGMQRYADTDRLLREQFGLAATRYDGDAVTQFEPALKTGLAGGWHYPRDAHLRPDKLLSSWRQVLEAQGVVIRERCRFRRFVSGKYRATAAEVTHVSAADAQKQGSAAENTAAGGNAAIDLSANGGGLTETIEADAFVVATGAWTPRLAAELGCRIPIQPGKGYSITMARPHLCPQIPLLFEEHKVVVTPMQSGYRLGSTMEFSGYDATLNPQRLELLVAGANRYLIEPTAEPVVERWFGWRPMTYDSVPIIDRSPTLENVLIAAGHNMLGLSMAPATGRLVAELLEGRQPHLDETPYALGRF